jgi:hypothetical protein
LTVGRKTTKAVDCKQTVAFLESAAMVGDWRELLRHPNHGDHVAQAYQDSEFLGEALGEYIGAGLRGGEAALVIARPEQRAKLPSEHAQLRVLDAQQTLGRLMSGSMPDWRSFQDIIGKSIAELRRRYARVRVYGAIVDLLWQRGQREAALRLEQYWNELARQTRFSLLCAYPMDPLASSAYGGPLERVCKAHTHLIPVRDYNRLNEAVSKASRKILDRPLAQMLLSLSANHRPATEMPLGQATLIWLKRNMPRTADKVLSEVRACWAVA